MMKQVLVRGFALFLLLSCNKDRVPSPVTGSGVYVVNEGNFNFGNADISFYNANTKQIANEVFKNENGFLLGDVAQSMYIKDSLGFIAVNNSRKVELIKIPSLQHLKTINIPYSSPRYILPADDSIAYVSELYSNKVHVVNYIAGTLKSEIAVPQYTEHLALVDEYIFAEGKKIYSNSNAKGAIFRLRIADNSYVDKQEFAGDAGGLVVDKNKHLWLAVDEDTVSHTNSMLVCFDKNLTVLSVYTMTNPELHPTYLCIDGSGTRLYFLSGKNVYATDISAGHPSLLFSTAANNVYSFSVDPLNGDFYLSDALDYVQSSRIYRYNSNGDFIHSFTAGINAGNFCFHNE